ncbi:MAG TPA: 6-bladed beta-propeller [Gemmatimonadaceae bacterium]|nr:6-bladed beta-propeller [Gemmatimonadaceae bacterium]
MISIARAALLLTPSLSFALTAPQDTVVRNAGAPKYPGVATLVQEVSIGALDGPDEYVFGEVADIAVGEDGAIYVLDRTVNAIRMYDANGKYLRTIGRRGQGPGEMMAASGITTLGDGRLLLWETNLWRVNVYSATGAVLTHWSLATTGGGNAMMSRAITSDTVGDVYVMKNWLV